MDISSMLEVQMDESPREDNSKENGLSFLSQSPPPLERITSSYSHISSAPDSLEELEHYKSFLNNADISQIRFHKLHCTACDAHIGSAPSEAYNMYEHPVLKTLLCAKCREFYGDGNFEQGDDHTDMFCRWCANGGNLFCCSYCSNTFCNKCLKRNLDSDVRKRIEAEEQWKCFVCDPTDLFRIRGICRALLQHIEKVTRIIQNDHNLSLAAKEEKMHLDESTCCNVKRKDRKRKRRISAVESDNDDDETYDPTMAEIPAAKRKKFNKPRLPNGVLDRPPPMPAPAQVMIPKSLINNNDPKLPQFFLEPNVMLSIPGQRVNATTTTLPQRVSPLMVKDPMKLMTFQRTTQQIQLPPMVTIPGGKRIAVGQKRILITKESRPPSVLSKVVQVDSDSDEPEIVSELPKAKTSQANSSQATNGESSQSVLKIPPKQLTRQQRLEKKLVELSGYSRSTDSPTFKNETTDIFNKFFAYQGEEIKSLLSLFKVKLEKVSSMVSIDATKDIARTVDQKARILHKLLELTVLKLVRLDSDFIRKYSRMVNTLENFDVNNRDDRTTNEKELESIPLELICECESDSSEDEMGDDEEMDEETLEELVRKAGLPLVPTKFRINLPQLKIPKTNTIGVGNQSVLIQDKGTQVSVLERDFEKIIGHSVISRDSPVVQMSSMEVVDSPPDENFGRYQEQFIFHLQELENSGIQTDESRGVVPDPNEVPLKDLIASNSPFLEHMLGSIVPLPLASDREITPCVQSTSTSMFNDSFGVNNDLHFSSRYNDELDKAVSQITDVLEPTSTVDMGTDNGIPTILMEDDMVDCRGYKSMDNINSFASGSNYHHTVE